MINVPINPNQPISWGFRTDNLTIGFYRAALIGPNGQTIYKWENQQTGDQHQDIFQIPFPSNGLKACILWVQAIIMDPTYQGRNFTAQIIIKQGNNTIANQTYQGTVPAGNGQMASISDTFKFV